MAYTTTSNIKTKKASNISGILEAFAFNVTHVKLQQTDCSRNLHP